MHYRNVFQNTSLLYHSLHHIHTSIRRHFILCCSLMLFLSYVVYKHAVCKIPLPLTGTHCSGLLPHRQALRLGNMLTVNQEIPEEMVQVEQAVLCPLLAGQMSVSKPCAQ